MGDLDRLFNSQRLNKEEVEAEVILHEFVSILSDLANEAVVDKRSYSCDDIADVLDTFVSSKLDSRALADALTLFGDMLRDAQHSIHRSIETQLTTLIDSDITRQQRILFTEIRREPQVFNWIKTSSV